MGGDSSHPLVVAIADGLHAAGLNVATPNITDPDVPLAAGEVALLADEMGAERVVLVGYSWGSVVVSHAHPDNVVARVLIAPPSSMPLGAPGDEARLMLVPEHDQYGGPDAFAGASIEIIPGEDHFLWGSIDTIAKRSVDWLIDLL